MIRDLIFPKYDTIAFGIVLDVSPTSKNRVTSQYERACTADRVVHRLRVLRTFNSIDIAAKLSLTTFAFVGALEGTFIDIDTDCTCRRKM